MGPKEDIGESVQLLALCDKDNEVGYCPIHFHSAR